MTVTLGNLIALNIAVLFHAIAVFGFIHFWKTKEDSFVLLGWIILCANGDYAIYRFGLL